VVEWTGVFRARPYQQRVASARQLELRRTPRLVSAYAESLVKSFLDWNQTRGVASVNARHAVHAYFQWIKLGHFKILNEVLNHKHKEKYKKNSSQIFVVKVFLQFKFVLTKEPFERVWFCYWIPQKILCKHVCRTGNTHAKSAIECVFPKENVITN